MPESKRDAEKRAKARGIDKSQVVKSDKGYYIAPQGIKSTAAKKAYAQCRLDGGSKEKCAKIAWSIENKKGK